jgi:hypothetical protein
MMVQDISNGAGVGVIDVTGNYANQLLDAIPGHRSHHTYFFQPFDQSRVIGYNPFQGVPRGQRPRVAQDIMELFKAIWGLDYDRTPLLLDLLRSSVRVLLDCPDSTMLSLYALLTNSDFRARTVLRCTDPLTRKFWTEFEAWDRRDKRDKPQPVLTRLRAFLSDPQLRNVLGQVSGALDLERVVRQRQIFLADLSRATLGAETSRLFGCLLATRLQSILAARTGGWPFYIYIPEAHLMHAEVAARILQSPVPHGGAVVSLDQIAGYAPDVRASLLTPQTLLAFRMAADDVRYVSPRFPTAQPDTLLPTLSPDRLCMSGFKYELQALDALPAVHCSRTAIIQRSQRALGVPRKQIEAKIERFIDGL